MPSTPVFTILVALASSAAGLVLTLEPSLVVVILGLAVCSCAIFLAQPASISLVAASIGEGRSPASGLYCMTYYAGGAAGAWGCGWAYVQAGWGGTVAAAMLILAGAVALAWAGLPDTREPSSRL